MKSLPISDYDKQALDFLESTGTALDVVYLYTGLYFPDDKENEKRDIYQFTLTNARGAYSAKFGDSIHNTERREFLKSSGTKPLTNPDVRKAKQLGLHVIVGSYRIASSDFKKYRGYKPSAYDILACLENYCPDTFEDFCSEYGYDDRPLSDHDKVMSIYLSVREQAKGLKAMFTDSELEQLAEIQ